MKISITGVTGYICGSLAERLVRGGHDVHGLVRNEMQIESVKRQGIVPVIGSLDDSAVLSKAAHEVDAVINAASSDHCGAVETLVKLYGRVRSC
jgi:uncharacterized protein YbjT (DUF2867 family)